MFTPREAIVEGLRNYVTVRTFASRSEYWWFALFYFCVVWGPLLAVSWLTKDAVENFQQSIPALLAEDPSTQTLDPFTYVNNPTLVWTIVFLTGLSILSWVALRIPLFTVSVRRVRDAGGWTGWPWIKLVTAVTLILPGFLLFLLILSIQLFGGDLMVALNDPNILTRFIILLLGYISSPIIALPAGIFLIIASLTTFVYTLLPSKYL